PRFAEPCLVAPRLDDGVRDDVLSILIVELAPADENVPRDRPGPLVEVAVQKRLLGAGENAAGSVPFGHLVYSYNRRLSFDRGPRQKSCDPSRRGAPTEHGPHRPGPGAHGWRRRCAAIRPGEPMASAVTM